MAPARVKIRKSGTTHQMEVVQPRVTRQTDFASLLQRMYGAVDKALTSLEDKPGEPKEMGPREINSLVSLAKILPLLEQAELARSTKVSGKALKDMSSEELKRLAAKVLKAGDSLAEEEA